MMALLPIIGWSHYIFIPWVAVCIPNWHSYKSYAFFYLTVSFFIPFSILVYCYYKIFVVARHQSRRVNAMEQTSMEAFNISSAGTTQLARPKQRLIMRKEKKAAMTLFAVMGVFIICVTPYCIVHLAYAFTATQNLLTALGITSMLSFINSAANPLIYGILNRKFRRVFVEVMKCYHCPWTNSAERSSGTPDYASDAFTTGASGRRGKTMLPRARDSGFVTSQTTSNRPQQDIFSISVAASSINTMAALGTNLRDLPRLTIYTSQLPIIEDEISTKDYINTRTSAARRKTSPIKSVTFSSIEKAGTCPALSERKDVRRSISESSDPVDSDSYKLETLLPVVTINVPDENLNHSNPSTVTVATMV